MERIRLDHSEYGFDVYQAVEGETIETRVERLMENGEAISDNSPLIYTARGEGVAPEYDIRTDRFEYGIEGMDIVAHAYVEQRKPQTEATPETTPTGGEGT